MFIVLAQQHLFSQSLFFTFGGKFQLLGVTFQNQTFYIGLCFFFFFNSLLSQLNSNIISPVFSRLIFSHPDEREHHGKNATLAKQTLYFILVAYDVWHVGRSLFSLLGILSNLGFFIATSLGYLMGDLGVKIVYINWPELLNFKSGGILPSQAQLEKLAVEKEESQANEERASLLRNAALKFKI